MVFILTYRDCVRQKGTQSMFLCKDGGISYSPMTSQNASILVFSCCASASV